MTSITNIGVDVGGTFTDVTAITADGQVLAAKVLTTPDDYASGIVRGIEQACGTEPLSPHIVVHGTTVATNAILSTTGLGRAAVVTTEGFRDVLAIGRTKRPNFYDLDWDKPSPVVPRSLVFEVNERVEPDGTVSVEPAREDLDALVELLAAAAVTAVAVCLVNSYANPHNEQVIAEHLAAAGLGVPIVCSTSLTREVQEFERFSTAALNAVLLEPVGRYVRELGAVLEARHAVALLVMQSNGGLIPARVASERPVALLESGPAAGALGAAQTAVALGLDKVIGFDMGGTTAKACLVEHGQPREAADYEVGGELSSTSPLLRGGGHAVRLPCIELSEVGAGGGSIAWVDDAGVLHVGPESAGSTPGPACYGRGGTQPTVADAQLVLGYLPETGLGGGSVTLSRRDAEAAIRHAVAEPLGVSVEEAAFGIYEISNATMARAIRAVSVERGYDVTSFAAVAFGGSGPLHAVATARALGIRRVIVPVLGGVFSALAMTAAEVRRDAAVSVQWSLATLTADLLDGELAGLEHELGDELVAMGFDRDQVMFRRAVDARYVGQSGRLEIAIAKDPSPRQIRADFAELHRQRFAHDEPDGAVELVTLRVTAVAPVAHPNPGEVHTSPSDGRRTTSAFFSDGGWQVTDVLRSRNELVASRSGPLLIDEEHTTILVPPGCTVRLGSQSTVEIDIPDSTVHQTDEVTGLSMEIVRHRLEALVDDMATLIPQTARSIIARESHDFSTALCAPDGSLIAQGLGGLVHLGSVPGAIAAVLARYPVMTPGDMFVLNDPYEGGTHLPDYIVVAPLFGGRELLGFAIAISHHSDVGGGVPGGHATGATDLFQEGVIVPPVRLVRGGIVDDDIWRIIGRNTRTPVDVRGDLHAQMAACRRAEQELSRLAAEVGSDPLARAMGALVEYTERLTRASISRLPAGRWTATDHLDEDGSGEVVDLVVDLVIDGDHVRADFSRSSPQVANGLNCNDGTLASAVYLGFRCILDTPIPDNAGFGRCFTITAEPGTIVSARDPAPVAARGLTAFRLADLMFKVLADVAPGIVWAAGEGGLSVVTIGGVGPRGWYLLMDTVGGGSGARPTKDGLQGIAPAIGNVRNNSVEAIERDFPVRIVRYGFVADTGGRGEFRGANAMVKEYEFLADKAVAFCRSDRRRIQPWGLCDGEPGAPSAVDLRRAGDAEWVSLPVAHRFELRRGDRLRVATAGGGGYGPPSARSEDAVREDLREGNVAVSQDA